MILLFYYRAQKKNRLFFGHNGIRQESSKLMSFVLIFNYRFLKIYFTKQNPFFDSYSGIFTIGNSTGRICIARNMGKT